jgi:glycosyltransferase involved in cell wall biosynthesis
MPTISIITINLNNKMGLEKTIQSVINQTYKDFEYIIIDGGSTDGSSDLIKNYENEINYWISERDDGIYEAMNKGMKHANGEYCLFLNSGDYLYDKYVFANVFLSNPCKDIVYGNIIIDFGETQEIRLSPEKITLNHLFRDTLWHPVSFIKRKLFDIVGYYDTSFSIAGDYDFFFKAFVIYNCSQQHINNIISVFNTQGISSKHDFADLVRKERNLTQINNLDSKVIDLYNELNTQIQELKQANILQQSSYNKLLNSKTYILVNLLKKNLLNPILFLFKR